MPNLHHYVRQKQPMRADFVRLIYFSISSAMDHVERLRKLQRRRVLLCSYLVYGIVVVSAVPITVLVWRPMIGDLQSYRRTACRLVTIEYRPPNASVPCGDCIADGSGSCVNSSLPCLVVTVDYRTDDDVSVQRAMLYSDSLKHKINVSLCTTLCFCTYDKPQYA